MSSEWSAGYVTDVNYTSGYYPELSPIRCRLPLLTAGHHAPKIENACELGFGQGLSVAIHAAAQSGVKWWGTDFNPAQAAHATEMARLSGSDAKLYDEAFSEFCSRVDLPDFDFIGLHGIWTWISDENRSVLVDFVRRKLRPGGVLYISYNTYPGWSSAAPLRHLMKRHADVMGAPGDGIITQTGQSLEFIDKLFALNPLYVAANPSIAERLKGIEKHDRKYLAHEYMNRDWTPMYFAEVEQWLSDAKLTFACSANTIDHMHNLNLTPDQIALMQSIPDPSLRETVRDYCVNQQFRRDYWIRGPRTLGGHEQVTALREERIVLSAQQNALPTKVQGVLGEAGLLDTIYPPILEYLSDYKIHTIGELEIHLGRKGVTFGQLTAAISILFGISAIQSVMGGSEIQKAKPRTAALNRAIAELAISGGDISHFASPITGSGVSAPRFHQLFWMSKQAGGKTPADWAGFVWQILSSQNQAIVKDGAPLRGDDNLVELTSQAQIWGEQVLPVWVALGL
ncbi:MAG: class I SAM-dependent methyltransferase [bacterium]|nr:class I SAM-dependent methyltransferase [bacterium]